MKCPGPAGHGRVRPSNGAARLQMHDFPNRRRHARARLAHWVLILACPLATTTVSGQEAPDPSSEREVEAGASATGPHLGLGVHVDIVYTSNLFRYQNRRLSDFRAGNQTGPAERFYRLKGPEDVVTTPGADVLMSWKHSDKRDTALSVGASYTLHARNPIANYLTLVGELGYDLTQRDTLSLETEFIPSRFKKNYASGEPAGIRFYERADYLKWSGEVAYEREWSKPWSTELAFGVGMRRFDDPFANRDGNSFAGRLGVEHDPWKRLTLAATLEIGRTLTADGVELGIRVDRAHFDLEPAFGATLDLPSRWEVEAGVAYRWRSYTTDESTDGVHFDRLDRRLALEGSVGKGFGKTFTLALEASYDDSNAGRVDPADDADEFGYEEFRVGLSAECVL